MLKIHSPYKPSRAQLEVIKQLVEEVKNGKKHQVLLGAMGTGKTFAIANVIEQTEKNISVSAHNYVELYINNKTLARQLYSELKELFPENRVEYFVSYYDVCSNPVLSSVNKSRKYEEKPMKWTEQY